MTFHPATRRRRLQVLGLAFLAVLLGAVSAAASPTAAPPRGRFVASKPPGISDLAIPAASLPITLERLSVPDIAVSPMRDSRIAYARPEAIAFDSAKVLIFKAFRIF